MKNLFKSLCTLLIMAVFSFTSCSKDDNDNNADGENSKIENFSAEIVNNTVSNKTYQFSWKGVNNAHSYQVYYRVKGNSEWQTTNVYIPNPNKPGEIMTHEMMAGFMPGISYEMKIVAHIDTSDRIIAESSIIEPISLPIVEPV